MITTTGWIKGVPRYPDKMIVRTESGNILHARHFLDSWWSTSSGYKKKLEGVTHWMYRV